MLDAIGGRKFLLTLLVIAVGTAVQILSPHGVTTEYAALLIGVSGVFSGANAFVTSKMTTVTPAADDAPGVPAATIVDLDAVNERLNDIEAQAKAHSESITQVQQGVLSATNAAKAALQVRVST